MSIEEQKSPPHERESMEPATDEQKEEIVQLINDILKEEDWGGKTLGLDMEWRGTHAKFPGEKRVANLTQYKKRKDGLVAIIQLVEFLEEKYHAPKKYTNYHIKRTPIDYQIEKKVHFKDEDDMTRFFDSSDLSVVSPQKSKELVDQSKAFLTKIEKVIENDAFEKEMGLQFFSVQDAKEVFSLFQQIKLEHQQNKKSRI